MFGFNQIWLKFPSNDHHFFYIFPMDDLHSGENKFLKNKIKNTDDFQSTKMVFEVRIRGNFGSSMVLWGFMTSFPIIQKLGLWIECEYKLGC